MPAPGARIDPSVRRLLELLREPPAALGATAGQWDGVVRIARTTRLLAPLGARLADHGLLDRIPPAVRAHIESEETLAAHRAQMARRMLVELDRVLGDSGFPVVLLKGTAYLAKSLACARGRLFSDVDLLVPRAHLDDAERLLLDDGWQFGELDAHDERYYRAWSHELPPLHHPSHPLQLDLHHSILPPTGRVRPDDAALLAAAVPLPGTSFRVLSPADQVLHACAHVFQDSNLAGMLRDVADVDALVQEHCVQAGFWDDLIARARLHELGRALWYGLHFSASVFGTRVPHGAWEALSFAAPGPLARWSMSRLGRTAMLPGSPDRLPSFRKRVAERLLAGRQLVLRFPVRLLAVHTAAKAWRRLRVGKPKRDEGE